MRDADMEEILLDMNSSILYEGAQVIYATPSLELKIANFVVFGYNDNDELVASILTKANQYLEFPITLVKNKQKQDTVVWRCPYLRLLNS